jgi:hypothetical protein
MRQAAAERVIAFAGHANRAISFAKRKKRFRPPLRKSLKSFDAKRSDFAESFVFKALRAILFRSLPQAALAAENTRPSDLNFRTS